MEGLDWKPDTAVELDTVLQVMVQSTKLKPETIVGVMRSIISALYHLTGEGMSFRLPDIGVVGQVSNNGIVSNVLSGPVNPKRANLATRNMVMDYALGSNHDIPKARELYEHIWKLFASVIKTMLDLGHPVAIGGIGCIVPNGDKYEWRNSPLTTIKSMMQEVVNG